jgi:hypothetical protein
MADLATEQSNKETILGQMETFLNDVLKTSKTHVGTQVDEGELLWSMRELTGLTKGKRVQSYKTALAN